MVNITNDYLLKRLPGYKGNSLLKKSGQKINWSIDLIREYIKCSKDVVYFTENYMKINSKDGLVNFELYPYQKKMLKNFSSSKFNIVTTARQAGKSTTTCAFILWFMLFNPDKTIALLANKGDTAREILYKVQLGYQNLPKWLQQGIVEWNKGSFSLENNSRIIATATSSDNIRGYTIDLLFIDEAAHIENWDEFYTSVYATISDRPAAKIILVSTPKGMNHFYNTWINAIENRNGYRWIKVIWSDIPGRGEKWKKETLRGMNFNNEKFEQEQCCEFLGSSGTLIAGWKLKQLVHKSPISEKDGLFQYKKPQKDHVYMTVCDVSRGKGLDYSAFQTLDVTTMPYEQVCSYRNNNITPVNYVEVILHMAKYYNNSSVLVEINDIGEQVSHMLYNDFNYEHVLFTSNSGRAGKQVTGGFGNSGGSVDKGIRTTQIVKNVGCSILKLLIEDNKLLINDYHTISELSTFSKKNNTYKAEEGKHDDLVMCLVLFAWLSDQQYFKDHTDINTLAELRDKSEEEMEQDMSAFGFICTGNESNWHFDEDVVPKGWLLVDDRYDF